MANPRRILKDLVVVALEETPAINENDIPVARHREPDQSKTYVWLWKASGEREFKVIGPSPAPNEEEIELVLRVVAIREDDALAEDDAEALAEVVELALRTLDLPAPFTQQLLVKKVDDEPLDFDTKVGHHVLMTVTTRARI